MAGQWHCRPGESIRYLGIMFNMDQKWDDQVKKMVDTLKHRGLQLSRSKLKHYHKRATEESKTLAAIKYALQVVQTKKLV